MHSLLALENDKRRPSSLGPIVWFQWLSLANLQAQTGDSAAAAQSLKNFVRDAGEMVAPLAAGDARRKLLVNPGQALEATLQLTEGASQSALTNASEVINRIDAVEGAPWHQWRSAERQFAGRDARHGCDGGHSASATTRKPKRWRAVGLRFPATRTRKRTRETALPAPVPCSPMLSRCKAATTKRSKPLQPALTYYEGEQKAGADGTVFRNDYAYALYVSAIAAPSDAAGRKQRDAALSQAAGLIAGASKEAQQLAEMRHTASLIAVARAAPAA